MTEHIDIHYCDMKIAEQEKEILYWKGINSILPRLTQARLDVFIEEHKNYIKKLKEIKKAIEKEEIRRNK